MICNHEIQIYELEKQDPLKFNFTLRKVYSFIPKDSNINLISLCNEKSMLCYANNERIKIMNYETRKKDFPVLKRNLKITSIKWEASLLLFLQY